MEGFFRNLFQPQQRRENRDARRNRRPNSTGSNNNANTTHSNNERRNPRNQYPGNANSRNRPRPTASTNPSDRTTQAGGSQPQPNPSTAAPGAREGGGLPPFMNGVPVDQLPDDILQFIMHQIGATNIPPEGMAFGFQVPGDGGPPETSNAPPPASTKAIRQLPIVAVTPQDLVDESNRECCICFEEHTIGEKVCRLPCAHIFHVKCIHQWLTKHCTCPICRYEVPTDNSQYEQGRKERMKGIKPRYARYELDRMTGKELRELCGRLRIQEMDIAGLDTRGVVEVILESGRIDVISAPDPVEYESVQELRNMGVGKLKKAMVEAGVFFDPIHVVEKEDMVQIFVNSGRIVFRQENPEENHPIPEYERVGSEVAETSNESNLDEKEMASVPFRDWDRSETGEIKRARLNDYTSDAENMESVEDVSDHGDEGIVSNDGSRDAEAGENLNTNIDSGSESETMQVETDVAETSSRVAVSPDSNRDDSESNTGGASAYSTSNFAARSVGELRQLAAQFDVDLSGCIEKKDMIDKLISVLT